jgi:multidrug efflux pump subunit AcrA (membrane-fusion protein)
LRAEPVIATGRIVPDEDATWLIGSVTDGRIANVQAKVGDLIRQEQVLANLHSHDVHVSRAGYSQALAELERREVLAAQALKVRDRARRLFELKAASREQVEAAETDYRSAQILVESAKTEIEKERTHLTDILNVPAEPPATSTSSDAHIADLVPIKAPAAGTLMERHVTSGSVVSQGDHVFTISDLTSLWMIAAINESDLSRLRVGQPATVSVRAYPNATFPGRIIKLGERLDPATRTLQVRVALSNKQSRLKPEMFATVAITGPGGRPAILVPPEAVQEVHGNSVVFLRTDRVRFIPRRVTTSGTVDSQIEILSGLQPGDEIVIKGAFVLKSELLKETEQ